MMDFNNVNLSDIKSLVKNRNIQITGKRQHTKASEIYIDVVFAYPELKEIWDGSIPIEYRRTGISTTNSKEIADLIEGAYNSLNPINRKVWLKTESKFWDSTKKQVTRPFFEVLSDCEWKCRNCDLPINPNWARRFQDIKEFGYTIATDTNKYCHVCKKNTTHLIMLSLPRGHGGRYETWSNKLRRRILLVLQNIDAYENRKGILLLPDHKFPEIRWDEQTHKENPDNMSDEEIRKKFQLLSNQRNQQKREACRNCYQTGKREYPHGVPFYYEGNDNWSQNVPRNGKDAERGCIGCGWYDLEKWRFFLNKRIKRD